MGVENKESIMKHKKVVNHSLRNDYFKIVEPELKGERFFDKINLETLNDFSTENEVIESLSRLLPEKVIMGDKSFNFNRMIKFDGFFSYLIFHSINQLHTFLFDGQFPINGSVQKSVNSIAHVEYNYIAIEEEFIEKMEYLIPIVLKNFKLFEEFDVFRKNANVIKDANERDMSQIAFFVNHDGLFENIQAFILSNKENILDLPSSIFGVETINGIEDRISEMENNIDEIIELRKLRDDLSKNINHSELSIEKGKHQIIKSEDLNKLIDTASKSDSGSVDQERLSILKKHKCLIDGTEIKFAKKEMLTSLNDLKNKFPNFSEVVDYLLGSISLSLLKEQTEFHFDPIILLGSPGLGKTAFSKALGKALGIRSEVWAVSQFNQGFTLSGLDLGWASGKTGKVFNCMSKNNIANPIILLDEIDKISDGIGGGASSVGSVFLQLFERETSTDFVDEAMDVPIDASLINWICTANDISEINSTLLSRLKVFNIRKPTTKEMPKIIDSIYKKLLEESKVGDCFVSVLPESFYSRLLEYEPRKVNKILKDSMRYSAQKVINTGIVNDLIVIDDFSFNNALSHEPNQKQKNMK